MTDEAAHRAFTRADPPADQVRAVAQALDLGAVRRVQVFEGGLESAVHRLDAERGSVVLRRFDPEHGWHTPAVIQHEIDVLSHLAPTPVRAPEVLLADPDGAITGNPMIVLSLLAGRTQAPPLVDPASMAHLVEAMQEVHACRPFARSEGGHESWRLLQEPAVVATSPRAAALWEVLDLVRGALSAEPVTMIHNDLHPGNTLWQDGRLTGLVDWGAAGGGQASFDVAYCAADLELSLGIGAGAGLLAAWRDATGSPLHPGWHAVATWALLADADHLAPSYTELGMPCTTAQVQGRLDDLLRTARRLVGLPDVATP